MDLLLLDATHTLDRELCGSVEKQASQLFGRQLGLLWTVGLALPSDEDSPTFILQFLSHDGVSLDVPRELRQPKLCVGLGNARHPAACMTMPEAPVHKDNGLMLRQDDIWLAWKLSSMQSKTESKAVERLPQVNLRFRVRRADA